MIKDKIDSKQNLTLENFEGPLDLLLHLIRKRKLDILEISLVEVANQYVDFVYSQEIINLDETSDYLLLASQLINIKTKSLLRTDVFKEKDENDDEKKDLIDQLIQYEKYKILSEDMKKIFDKTSAIFEKEEDEFVDYLEKQGDKTIRIISNGTEDIEKAMESLLELKRNRSKESKITSLRITRKSAEQIKQELLESIKKGSETFFDSLQSKNYYYIALALLVILEMAKNGEVKIEQQNDFREISIRSLNEK